MSVYSELLRMALAQDGRPEISVGELVSQALSQRPADSDEPPSAEHIARWLAYDVILVRLCDMLGVPHRMLDPDAGPSSRSEAERLVATKVSLFSRALNSA